MRVPCLPEVGVGTYPEFDFVVRAEVVDSEDGGHRLPFGVKRVSPKDDIQDLVNSSPGSTQGERI